MKASHQTALLGLCIIALAGIALLFWLPNDTVSGFVQSRRGRLAIGDAMAPGLAFGLMALSGLLILFKAREACTALVTRHDVIFVLGLLGLVAVSFTLMRYSGPVLAGLFADGGDYRALRDTTPWKHLGFVFGGGGMVAALISWMERRVTLRSVLIGFAAAIALILVFDAGFDDLLLPPNGDV